jgi:hypothetical protein
MLLSVLHSPLESATTMRSQETQRELGLSPMLGGVPSHDEQHCEPAPARVFTLPVQLRWRQPSQGHPDLAIQTPSLFTKRGGRRGSRGEFPIAISLHDGATERPEQVLLGVPEHVRDDGHETVVSGADGHQFNAGSSSPSSCPLDGGVGHLIEVRCESASPRHCHTAPVRRTALRARRRWPESRAEMQCWMGR